MKLYRHLAALAVTLACFCYVIADNTGNEPDIPGKKPKKVVFIIVDGLSADMIENKPTPNLDAVAKKGGYTPAYVGGKKGGYSETPTISAVGYNSLLTGTWVNKHNVWGNSIKAPNYHYPTVFRLLKDQYPDKKTAVFSTWLDNRTKLIGEGLEETGKTKIDYAYDGFELDTVNFPHDPERTYIRNIDEKVALEAARYIRTEGPDLSWVYLEYSDDMGHKYGDSPQLDQAIAFEDHLIGEIWNAIQYREENKGEEWLFIITTDHGRTQETGHHHGGQSDRERSTWIVTNSPDTNAYFSEETPGIVDILPTIADYMDIDIPEEQIFELDGISLTGQLNATQLEAELQNGELIIRWKSTGKHTGRKASIWISESNHYRTGGKDHYTLAGKVPVREQLFRYIPKQKGNFYKIVLQTPKNTLNTWVKTTN